jgi:hypothetical protein
MKNQNSADRIVYIMTKQDDIKELVIPKEKAVFWMDASGKWQNEHGPFEHPKIIAYFNSSIRKDKDGYFVAQIRDGLREKVYFRHQDTPLFVVQMQEEQHLILILNTGTRFPLEPRKLFIRNDHLYVHIGDEYAKFSERLLVRFAEWLDYHGDRIYFGRNTDRVEIKTEKT